MELKVIVAGGREFNDYDLASKAIMELANETFPDREVSIVSGMARGADALGVAFARNHSVQLYEFPAHWDKYGKRAGFMRNEEMGKFADVLLAFWDGKSPGSKHMIEYMKKLNKPVYVIPYQA